MTVSVVTPEPVEPEPVEGDCFVLGGTTRVAINTGITIYDSDSTNITLGEYAIAIDSTGKVFYASRTGDYGGPHDGFYHDGSYVFTKGEVCGIFDIDSRFDEWPNTVVIDGQTVNAWTLYTVVCPEGCKIITGSQEAMSSLIKALCNITTFTETNNALFENTIEDGSITTLITIEIAAE